MARITCTLVLLGLLLSACRTSEEIFQHGEILTYEQYQSIKIADKLTADVIKDRYGRPKIAHERNDKIERLIYRCQDMTGRFRDLELVFDKNEVLIKKKL